MVIHSLYEILACNIELAITISQGFVSVLMLEVTYIMYQFVCQHYVKGNLVLWEG